MARRQDGDYEVPVIAEAAVGGESATNRAPRILNVSLDDIDLDNVQRDWEQQLDALLAQWFTVTRDQRNDILDQVKTAVDRNDVRALARLIASIEDAIEALTDAMSAMALTAAQEMVDEAAAQGVRIDPVATDRAPLADIAAAVAALLAEGLTNAAGREALRHYATGASGEDVARSVREHLESLSDSFIRDNLGGALSKAQLVGRMETALAGPEAAMYSSEILDKRICEPCRKVHHKWLGNSSDMAQVWALYPGGQYVHCLGGIRCRGQVICVYRPEQVPGATPPVPQSSVESGAPTELGG